MRCTVVAESQTLALNFVTELALSPSKMCVRIPREPLGGKKNAIYAHQGQSKARDQKQISRSLSFKETGCHHKNNESGRIFEANDISLRAAMYASFG